MKKTAIVLVLVLLLSLLSGCGSAEMLSRSDILPGRSIDPVIEKCSDDKYYEFSDSGTIFSCATKERTPIASLFGTDIVILQIQYSKTGRVIEKAVAGANYKLFGDDFSKVAAATLAELDKLGNCVNSIINDNVSSYQYSVEIDGGKYSVLLIETWGDEEEFNSNYEQYMSQYKGSLTTRVIEETVQAQYGSTIYISIIPDKGEA